MPKVKHETKFNFGDASGQRLSNGIYSFVCPGCGDTHYVPTDPAFPMHGHDENGRPKIWGFNFDLNNPTFTPSILYQTGRYVPGLSPETVADYATRDYPYSGVICHTFVTNGQIQFLADCTHPQAGKTIPLPEITL